MTDYPYTYHSWSDLQSLGETIAEHVIVKLEKENIIKQTWDRNLDDYRVQLGAPGPYCDNDEPIGWDHPYSPNIFDSDIKFQNAMTSGLPKLFTTFSIPDPADGEAALQALYTAAMLLDPDLQITMGGGAPSYPYANPIPTGLVPPQIMINTVNSQVNNWGGEAAVAFKHYFDEFGNAVNLQGVSLAVSATVVSVLVNGIAGALTNSFTTTPTPDFPLGGPDTSTVLDNMRARLTTIYNNWVDGQSKIGSALTTLTRQFDAVDKAGPTGIELRTPNMNNVGRAGKAYLTSDAGFFES